MNRRAIMVWRVASQVQGNAGFLWKVFRSGILLDVTKIVLELRKQLNSVFT